MPLIWNLKKWLAVEHDIYRPSELQQVLADKAGVQLSVQALSALTNGKPEAFRVQTIQALCDALGCKLSDFCDITPNLSSVKDQSRQRKAAGGEVRSLYGSAKSKVKSSSATSQESIFPDPHQLLNQPKEGN